MRTTENLKSTTNGTDNGSDVLQDSYALHER